METENDLMDMVVIDEYDSTKPKSENESKSSKGNKSKHSRKSSKKGLLFELKKKKKNPEKLIK